MQDIVFYSLQSLKFIKEARKALNFLREYGFLCLQGIDEINQPLRIYFQQFEKLKQQEIEQSELFFRGFKRMKNGFTLGTINQRCPQYVKKALKLGYDWQNAPDQLSQIGWPNQRLKLLNQKIAQIKQRTAFFASSSESQRQIIQKVIDQMTKSQYSLSRSLKNQHSQIQFSVNKHHDHDILAVHSFQGGNCLNKSLFFQLCNKRYFVRLQPGQMIINTGIASQLISDQFFRSTVHGTLKVSPNSYRMSHCFFLEPRINTKLKINDMQKKLNRYKKQNDIQLRSLYTNFFWQDMTFMDLSVNRWLLISINRLNTLHKSIKIRHLNKAVTLIELDIVQSTHTMLNSLNPSYFQNKFICLTAQEQIAGKGQRNNQWISIKGNMHLSLYFKKDKKSVMHLLPFYLAFSVLKSLEQQKVEVGIKWINDIILNGKKLGGILVSSFSTQKGNIVVASVGLNIVKSPVERGISLAQLGISIQIQHLKYSIISNFIAMLEKNPQKLRQEVEKKITLIGKTVQIWDQTYQNVLTQGTFLRLGQNFQAVLANDGVEHKVQNGRMLQKLN